MNGLSLSKIQHPKENPQAVIQNLRNTLPEIHAFLAPFQGPKDIYSFADAIYAIHARLLDLDKFPKEKVQINALFFIALKIDFARMEWQALALLEGFEHSDSREESAFFRGAHTILTGWLSQSGS